MLNSPVAGFDGAKALSQKLTVATRLIIINLEIRLKGMADRVDRTRYLMFQLKHSISETCKFLDAKFR